MHERYQGTKPLIDASAAQFPGSNPSRVLQNSDLSRLNNLLVVTDSHLKNGQNSVAVDTLKLAKDVLVTVDHVQHSAHAAYYDMADRLGVSVPPKEPTTAEARLAKAESMVGSFGDDFIPALEALIEAATHPLDDTEPVADDPATPEDESKTKRKSRR